MNLKTYRDGLLKGIRLAAILPIILSSQAAMAGDYLYPGTNLYMGQSIVSSAGKYSLVMQADGSLVMYRNDGTVRYRFAKNGWFAAMQNDGNFVEYNSMVSPVWNSGTWGHPGSLLHIQDDGNLVVYSATWAPLWSIGAEPEPIDPRLQADVIGRDLDAPVVGFLGHLGLYDGGGNVIEAMNKDGNALEVVTLNKFKSTTHHYWGTASPNIPAGITQFGCYRVHCVAYDPYLDTEQLEMRNAIVRVAYVAQLIGATYTASAQFQPYSTGWGPHLPERGVFRCDTFVLATMYMPQPYQFSTDMRKNWANFIFRFVQYDAKTPGLVFDRMASYR